MLYLLIIKENIKILLTIQIQFVAPLQATQLRNKPYTQIYGKNNSFKINNKGSGAWQLT